MNSLIGHDGNQRPGILRWQYYKDRLGRNFEIVNYNGEPVYQNINQYLSHGLLCQAEELVSANTGKVVAWRYVPGSDPQKCTRPKYHCGGW